MLISVLWGICEMGMAIDTVTKWLGIIRANFKVFPEVGSDKKIESLDTAISYLDDYQQLMRKYQKIREIAFPLQFCSTDKLEHEAIMKICEVLEDDKERND
jgi:hypothetical protein